MRIYYFFSTKASYNFVLQKLTEITSSCSNRSSTLRNNSKILNVLSTVVLINLLNTIGFFVPTFC